MRLVHAHFPINISIPKDGKSLEIKNFLGGKQIKKVDMLPGCIAKMSPELKDEIVFEGIDVQNLSLTCAQISQSCKIGDKDDRKFLDGIYVSEKGRQDWALRINHSFHHKNYIYKYNSYTYKIIKTQILTILTCTLSIS